MSLGPLSADVFLGALFFRGECSDLHVQQLVCILSVWAHALVQAILLCSQMVMDSVATEAIVQHELLDGFVNQLRRGSCHGKILDENSAKFLGGFVFFICSWCSICLFLHDLAFAFLF